VGLKQIVYGGVEWIHLVWDVIEWRAVVNRPPASSTEDNTE